MSLRVIDDLVEIVEVDFYLWLVNVDPASLAAQVAAVENGDVDERGEVDSFLLALFKKVYGAHPFVAKIPHELGEVSFVSAFEGSRRKLETGDNHVKWVSKGWFARRSAFLNELEG